MSDVVQFNGRIEDLSEKVKEGKDKLERKTLNINELAAVLGCGTTKARQLVKSKNGPPVLKIGNKYYIPIQGFETWLNTTAVGKEF